MLASCTVEAEQIADLYGADPARIVVVAPGVDHAFFGPGHRPQARRALGLSPDGTLLLFVGRIQPLKGADVAVRALAELSARRPQHGFRLVVVGGPSGPHGDEAYKGLVELAAELGVDRLVDMVAPQPHELLSTYYRAADVCLVPSRSESFGLVALEAAACGTPVVASAVGGLTTLVDHGRTGFLVDEPSPTAFADYVRRIVEEPLLAERLSTAAVLRARAYTWRRRRPSSGRSTTSWWPAGSSSALRPPRLRGAAGRSPRGEGAMAAGGRPDRRLGRPRALPGRHLRPGGRRAPGRHRPHRLAPVVPALQGGGEGLHHRLADPAAAHPPPRGPVHAGAGGERGRGVCST